MMFIVNAFGKQKQENQNYFIFTKLCKFELKISSVQWALNSLENSFVTFFLTLMYFHKNNNSFILAMNSTFNVYSDGFF